MDEEQISQQQLERRQVLDQYARIGKKGRPAMCGPAGSRPHVIFDTVKDAQAAADKLTRFLGIPQYVYPCRHSRSGHLHLTTKPPRETDPRSAPCVTNANSDV